MRRFDVDRPSLDLYDCLRTLPRRISRTYRACRRPVRRARFGRRDLYYPHLLLVRVVFLSFRSHLPPPPLLILLSSFCSIAIQHHHPLSINPIYRISHRISHSTSPISHLPSHLIHLSHSLSLLRILPSLRSYLLRLFVWKNPHADKLFLSFLSPLLSSHMQHASIWLAPCSHVLVWLYGPVVDGRFVCSHGLFLCACRAVYFDTATPDADADVTCERLNLFDGSNVCEIG